MSRVFVIVEHDDGRLVGIEGASAVVVEMEREPVAEWIGADVRSGIWSTRYTITLEFPDGFTYYTPTRPPTEPQRGELDARSAALPAGEHRGRLT